MTAPCDSRNALIGLVDEVTRLNGRLKSTFAAARRDAGLGESEMMVLNAVVEAQRPPTVAQIGRSMGQPRQIVQRAANSLLAAGLIGTTPNPDHKRAVLLVATSQGIARKQKADARADAVARAIGPGIDLVAACDLVGKLRTFRKQLEAQMRAARGELGGGDNTGEDKTP